MKPSRTRLQPPAIRAIPTPALERIRGGRRTLAVIDAAAPDPDPAATGKRQHEPSGG